MKKENINRGEIKITINNSPFKIIYYYNGYTTFQDLLEYLASFITSFNICDCYEFEYYFVKISKNSRLVDYSSRFGDLYLRMNNKNCNHSNDNYLFETKKYIYDLKTDMENKLKKLEHELFLKSNEAYSLKYQI